MSSVAFIALAIFTLAAALAAALLPKLVHAALSFAAAFFGVAGFYFLLGSDFVVLVQIFVFVGAVSVLFFFPILLHRAETEREPGCHGGGLLVAGAVFAGLVWAVVKTGGLNSAAPPTVALTVRQIGEALMTDYVWPLPCIGVLLTAALIGALVLVLEEKR